MTAAQVLVTLVGLAAIAALLFLAFCRYLGLWHWVVAWLNSSKEEKVGLTRGSGHYNANGYLVSSDSDIHLATRTGSFKHLDPVDRDFRVLNETTVNLGGSGFGMTAPQPAPLPQQCPLPQQAQGQTQDETFPPQPLRLAPAPPPPAMPAQFAIDTLSQGAAPVSAPGFAPGPAPVSATGFAPGPAPVSATGFAPGPAPVSAPGFAPGPAPVSATGFAPGPAPVSAPGPAQGFAQSFAPVAPVSAPAPIAAFTAGPANPFLASVPALPPPAASQPLLTFAPQQRPSLPPVQSQWSVESVESELGSPDHLPPTLQRAMSCDSVSSDTSVLLADLEDFPQPHVTGHLCVGLEYDSEAADLVVSVLEGKDLVGPDPEVIIDTYVRVYLLPDKTTNMQTRVYKKSNNPVYKEKFLFALESHEFSKRSLVFYVYASDKFSNTLIGEAEIKMCDVNVRQPATTWLTLTDTGQRGGELGEIMFSLSYLPTAERLTVVVVKARNLRFPHQRETGDPFVKVYLVQNGKKVSKKKSSTKKGEKSPIFNEAMIFSVPAHALQTIQLRITVAESEGEGRAYSLGHVIVGSQASGKALSHWNQMLSSLRKPIAMWHALLRK